MAQSYQRADRHVENLRRHHLQHLLLGRQHVDDASFLSSNDGLFDYAYPFLEDGWNCGPRDFGLDYLNIEIIVFDGNNEYWRLYY